MGAILSAATELTGVDCAYNSSVTTIDLSNSTALEFTKALLQKYAQRVTYREFVYMITADGVGTFSYDVVAVNNEGVQSAAEAAVLTVKASSPIRDWIGGLFGRWF